MAVATVERLKSPVNIEPLLNGIRGLVNIQRTPEPFTWESIWSSGIPSAVIYATAGRCFKYEAALLYPVSPEQNEGVSLWRKQTRRELLDHLHRTPQSREVYRSLRQAHKVIPLDTQETLGDKWQRITECFKKGRDRF